MANKNFETLAAGFMKGFVQNKEKKAREVIQKKKDTMQDQLFKLQLQAGKTAQIKAEQDAATNKAMIDYISGLPGMEGLAGALGGGQSPGAGPTSPGQPSKQTPGQTSGPQFGSSFNLDKAGGPGTGSGGVDPAVLTGALSGGENQQAVPGQPGQGGGGAVDQIVQGQMNPLVAAFAKKITGIDVPGALRLGETRRSNKVREDVSQASLDERISSGEKRRALTKSSQIETESQNDIQNALNKRKQDFSESEVVWKRRMIDGVEWDVPFTKQGNEIKSIERIKTKGKKGQSVETAAKSESMKSGIRGVKKVRKMITNPDGTINKKKLAQLKPIPFLSSRPIPDWMVKAIPGFSDQPPVGQRMASMYNQAMESLIRGESGAAVPPEELVRLAIRYGIDWTQGDATIKFRMDELETILSGSVQAIDPQNLHLYKKEDVFIRVYTENKNGHFKGEREAIVLPKGDGSMPQPSSDKVDDFEIGQIETDADGNKAKYTGGGVWVAP